MKVVALHTDFRLYWPARLKHLSLELEKRGDQLTIIEIAGKGSPYAFASESNDRPDNWLCLFPEEKIEDIDPKAAKKEIFKLLNEIRPEVIIAGAIAFPSGASAVDWAKRNNKAVVIFDDSKLEDVPRGFIVNTIKKMVYANVDAIFCPAEDWIDTFQYWGFSKEAVFFGEDVVDNHYWNIKTNDTQSLPKKYFLSVGRQIERKNLKTLVDSFCLLHKQHPDTGYELVLVGNGPQRKELEYSIPIQMKEKIHFLNFKSPVDLREIYQRAAFFVLPSRSEQWGLVVNEAMAAGLPIAVSRQCGCALSLVQRNENGFVFDANDVSELTNILIKVDQLSDEERMLMAEKSKEIIARWDLDRFSSGAIAAMEYAKENKKQPSSIFEKYLLRMWNGRYNPN